MSHSSPPSTRVILVCKSAQNVDRLTGAARDIELVLRARLAGLTDPDLAKESRAADLKEQLLSDIRAMEVWKGKPPQNQSVLLQNLMLPPTSQEDPPEPEHARDHQ